MAVDSATLAVLITMQDQISQQMKKTTGGLRSTIGFMGKAIAADLAISIGRKLQDIVVEVGRLTVSFDKEMRNVNSIAKLSEAEFQKLSQGVIDLSKDYAVAAPELAGGLYSVYSAMNEAGFDTAQSLAVLEAAAQGSIAGVTDLETSASALISVLNAYPEGTYTAQEAMDILFKTVELGVPPFKELAPQMNQIMALAARGGVSLEEMGAAMAVMTRSGLNAAEASTSLQAVLVSILDPGEKAEKAMEKLELRLDASILKNEGLVGVMKRVTEALGKNTTTMHLSTIAEGNAVSELEKYWKALWDTNEKLKEKIEYAEKNETMIESEIELLRLEQIVAQGNLDTLGGLVKQYKATGEELPNVISFTQDLTEADSEAAKQIAEVFGSVRALRGMLALVAEDGQPFLDFLVDMYDSSGATKKALEEQSKSLDNQLKLFKNSVHAIGLEIGTTLIPSFNKILAEVIPIIRDFGEDVNPIIKKFGEDILPPMMASIKEALPPLKEFGAKFLEDLIPIIKDFGEEVLPIIIKFGEDVLPTMSLVIKAAIPIIGDLISLTEGWDEIWADIFLNIAGVIDGFISKIDNIDKTITNILPNALTAIDAWAGNVIDSFNLLVDEALNWGWDLIKNFVLGIVNKAKEIGGVLGKAIMGLVEEAGLAFDTAANDAMAQKWGRDLMSNWGEGVKQGTNKAKKDVDESAKAILRELENTQREMERLTLSQYEFEKRELDRWAAKKIQIYNELGMDLTGLHELYNLKIEELNKKHFGKIQAVAEVGWGGLIATAEANLKIIRFITETSLGVGTGVLGIVTTNFEAIFDKYKQIGIEIERLTLSHYEFEKKELKRWFDEELEFYKQNRMDITELIELYNLKIEELNKKHFGKIQAIAEAGWGGLVGEAEANLEIIRFAAELALGAGTGVLGIVTTNFEAIFDEYKKIGIEIERLTLSNYEFEKKELKRWFDEKLVFYKQNRMNTTALMELYDLKLIELSEKYFGQMQTVAEAGWGGLIATAEANLEIIRFITETSLGVGTGVLGIVTTSFEAIFNKYKQIGIEIERLTLSNYEFEKKELKRWLDEQLVFYEQNRMDTTELIELYNLKIVELNEKHFGKIQAVAEVGWGGLIATAEANLEIIRFATESALGVGTGVLGIVTTNFEAIFDEYKKIGIEIERLTLSSYEFEKKELKRWFDNKLVFYKQNRMDTVALIELYDLKLIELSKKYFEQMQTVAEAGWGGLVGEATTNLEIIRLATASALGVGAGVLGIVTINLGAILDKYKQINKEIERLTLSHYEFEKRELKRWFDEELKFYKQNGMSIIRLVELYDLKIEELKEKHFGELRAIAEAGWGGLVGEAEVSLEDIFNEYEKIGIEIERLTLASYEFEKRELKRWLDEKIAFYKENGLNIIKLIELYNLKLEEINKKHFGKMAEGFIGIGAGATGEVTLGGRRAEGGALGVSELVRIFQSLLQALERLDIASEIAPVVDWLKGIEHQISLVTSIATGDIKGAIKASVDVFNDFVTTQGEAEAARQARQDRLLGFAEGQLKAILDQKLDAKWEIDALTKLYEVNQQQYLDDEHSRELLDDIQQEIISSTNEWLGEIRDSFGELEGNYDIGVTGIIGELGDIWETAKELREQGIIDYDTLLGIKEGIQETAGAIKDMAMGEWEAWFKHMIDMEDVSVNTAEEQYDVLWKMYEQNWQLLDLQQRWGLEKRLDDYYDELHKDVENQENALDLFDELIKSGNKALDTEIEQALFLQSMINQLEGQGEDTTKLKELLDSLNLTEEQREILDTMMGSKIDILGNLQKAVFELGLIELGLSKEQITAIKEGDKSVWDILNEGIDVSDPDTYTAQSGIQTTLISGIDTHDEDSYLKLVSIDRRLMLGIKAHDNASYLKLIDIERAIKSKTFGGVGSPSPFGGPMPFLQTGAFITRQTLAMLHPNEAVIPLDRMPLGNPVIVEVKGPLIGGKIYIKDEKMLDDLERRFDKKLDKIARKASNHERMNFGVGV